jgi:hypothetical protein
LSDWSNRSWPFSSDSRRSSSKCVPKFYENLSDENYDNEKDDIFEFKDDLILNDVFNSSNKFY